jgi:hypothetical protein
MVECIEWLEIAPQRQARWFESNPQPQIIHTNFFGVDYFIIFVKNNHYEIRNI